jgi:hypothetical protein
MKHIIVAGVAAMLAVLGNIDSAGALISRPEAWSRCLKAVNAVEPRTPRTATNDVHRRARMEACMARMGYLRPIH